LVSSEAKLFIIECAILWLSVVRPDNVLIKSSLTNNSYTDKGAASRASISLYCVVEGGETVTKLLFCTLMQYTNRLCERRVPLMTCQHIGLTPVSTFGIEGVTVCPVSFL
jgi:ketopantoate hydroxymethyltransferase